MTTTETENKELVRLISAEAWSEGNLDLIDQHFAEDFVSHNPAVGEIRGPEEYKEQIAMFHSAFTDFELAAENIISEGDWVAFHTRLTGTHEGEFLGIEPTGKRVESTGMVMGRIVDGKVVEEWPQPDMMGLMQQLGVVEPPKP